MLLCLLFKSRQSNLHRHLSPQDADRAMNSRVMLNLVLENGLCHNVHLWLEHENLKPPFHGSCQEVIRCGGLTVSLFCRFHLEATTWGFLRAGYRSQLDAALSSTSI